MRPDDEIRLHHMLDAAREALGFTRGRTRDDLVADRQLLLAVVKDIEIVGEAAAHVSPETRALLPDIPWKIVVSTRNRLIHGYFDVDPGIVWDTVTNNLPTLVAELERHLQPD